MAENLTPKKYIDDSNMKQILTAVKNDIPTTVAELTDSSSYAKTTDIPSLDGYAKSEEIPTKVSQLENDSNYLSSVPTEYITETELDAKGYLTEHQDLSSYAKKDDIANTAIVHELTESEYNNLSESEQNNGDFYHIIDKNAVSNNSWEKGEFEYICDIFTDVVRSELLISKDFISVSISLRGGVWDSYEWLTLARTGIPRSSSCGLIALVIKSNDTIADKSYPVYAVYEKDGRINIINTNPAMPISEIQLHATIPRI